MRVFLFDEGGSVITEYGLLVVVVALSLVVVLGLFRDEMWRKFMEIKSAIAGVSVRNG